MNTANRIKELRTAKGLSQAELATAVGLTRKSIINYENGLREPNSRAMAALEGYFRVSGAYLRGEIDDPGNPKLEDPDIIEMLNKTDAFLSQTLLPNYYAAAPEVQFEIRNALAQINFMLASDDDQFKKYGSLLIRLFCANAYDFMKDCSHLSSGSSKNCSTLGTRGLHLAILSDQLKDISEKYIQAAQGNIGVVSDSISHE